MMGKFGSRSMVRKKASMRDIADRLSVSPAAVSMALRDSPNISLDLRNKVKQLATELGYVVDPGLREAMRRVRSSDKGPNLALICLLPGNDRIQNWGGQYAQILGMRERVIELGYHLDEQYYTEGSLHPDRLHSVLRARGIRGVAFMVVPGADPSPLGKIDWSEFSCLSFGYDLKEPAVDRVCNSFQTGIRMAVEAGISDGRKRIALLLEECNETSNQFRTETAFHGCMRWYKDLAFEVFLIKAMFKEGIDELRAQLKAFSPDLVISNYPEFGEKLIRESGRTMPEDTAIISIHYLREYQNIYTCLDFGLREQGAEVADLLLGQLYLNKYGLPSRQRTIQIEPSWIMGTSFALHHNHVLAKASSV